MSPVLDSFELHPVRLPMRHRFRRIDHREAVLVRGPAGWGEFSPFREYPPEVTARWLASALESACSVLPDPLRRRIPVNVTVPAVDPTVAAEIVAESASTTAKVKVAEPGQDDLADMARLEAVRRALGPKGRIRIDANGAWDVSTAVARIEALATFGLEYVEQPVASLDEMRQVRDSVAVPIAADESVRTALDPLEVVEAGAADLLVLKVQPLGGVQRTLDLAARAGLPVVVSSALETSVGMAAGLAAAAALPELEYACGLGTVALLDGDVVDEPLLPREGWLEVRRPEPLPELLERYHPGREQAGEMLRRVRAAAELLT
ncbi:MAG TPA: o-succinylbenzoate synthase [Acidimicrobiia bacterium]|nr:o-succinylbenzoate synthase [Acidimicrobiia bacterium]